MATTLTGQLPDRQRAALEHFEDEGFALTGSRSYASGPVLVVENDQGAEIEIDDLGCCLATGDERFATTSVNAPARPSRATAGRAPTRGPGPPRAPRGAWRPLTIAP